MLTGTGDLSQPAVRRLGHAGRPRGLDPLHAVPGDDGTDAASDEHDRSNKVPDGLESNLDVKKT